MIFSAFRQACLKAPLVAALLLGSAPAQAGWFSADKPAQKAESSPAPDRPAAPATNLEDSIRQAQLLRLAGQYPEAVKHLSQLMLVASDDQRVISEYGKTLAAMGRASDAVNFLTRAQQLQPNDWTVYSAMGVAYDQIGDQKSAKDAYEHALSLKPDEASVLSNYALSRMLAKDPDMARKLATRAENAGGAGDAKIARNIAMIRSLAPEESAPVQAAAQPAPVVQNPVPPQTAKAASHTPEAHDNRVVMQRVPVDPQAGPVAPIKAAETKPAPVNGATHAPRTLQPQLAADTPQGQTFAAPAQPAPKPVTSQPLPPPVAPMKAADLKPSEAKPVPVKTADTAKPPVPVAAKTVPAPPAKTVETASASVTLRLAPPLKGETDIPGQAPKVLPPAPVKAAAKPKAGDIPGLRVSANAY